MNKLTRRKMLAGAGATLLTANAVAQDVILRHMAVALSAAQIGNLIR
jgi:hypothetical protein